MRTKVIDFPNLKTLCIFLDVPSDLEQVLSEMQLEGGYPVIVLIGGAIDERQAVATEHTYPRCSFWR